MMKREENRKWKESGCWKYEEKENTISIIEYLGEEEVVRVPEAIDEKEIKEVGKYAFYKKNIKELSLPKTVDTIGSHMCYECRQLEKIEISDYLVEIGDGAFKNCRQLSEIEIFIYQRRYTCLKNLLSEMSQQVLCKFHDKERYMELVFPAYTHNYQENTMARIINQETYGAGAHYREAITKEKILYKEYDSRFYLAENVEQIEALYEIALARLRYPVELLEKDKERYVSFLKKNWVSLLQWLLKAQRSEVILWLGNYEEITEEQMKQLLNLLQQEEEIELLSQLMEVNQRRFSSSNKKKSFVL